MRLRFPVNCGALIMAYSVGLLNPLPSAGQQVSGEEVRLAQKAAINWLQAAQSADGQWQAYGPYEGGITALATLALLNAGVSPDRAWMQKALAAVENIQHRYTYVVSLKIQALVAGDPIGYRPAIESATKWLIQAQQANGMWTYGIKAGTTDFSNSQFALLGLHEAAKAGVEVPQGVWRKAERSWIRSQRSDGGWSYRPGAGNSTGSMTAAGLASLYITGNTLETHKESGFENGQAPGCGQYGTFRPIVRGLDWLGKNFTVLRNPNSGGWLFYYLYGLERVGIISGLRYFGKHDWYREGAAKLISSQQADGHWRGDMGPVIDTAFALLFLAKGHRPVLINKLKWSNDQRWNLDRHDIAHLVEFIGDRLGEPVSWEVVPLSSDVQDWLTAPILYFNGHVFPQFGRSHIEKLKEFVNNGGTILAEACCGREEFREGFMAFAKEAFSDYELRRLTPDHPVFKSKFELDGSAIELYGLAAGCRTSVFFSPHDLSCLWEQANIPDKSRAAFELGTNIAAYATGLEPLPDKLDVVRVVEQSKLADDQVVPPRGALYIAQLMHNGDWRPNPKAIPNLADYLHSQMGVDMVPNYEPIRPTDPKLAQHPIVYMTGHFSFELSAEETTALRQHLERGGFLFANACCGRQAFDESFRKLAQALFPDHPLEPLPPDHPIIAGKPGVPLTEVNYRPSMQAENPDLKEVRLEGISLNGRTVVVYSRFSIDCGLDGHACFACRGLAPEDARRVAGNILLYALSY